jgi:hypothetical protein
VKIQLAMIKMDGGDGGGAGDVVDGETVEWV